MNSNTNKTERPRGRPVDNNQQDLKSQILDAAEALFANNGYAATSIRRIADAVGVNTALIHYYFDNKKVLLQKVMERSLEPMSQALAEMKEGTEASPVLITKLMLSMLEQHPNMSRLMTREVLLPGGEMQEFFAVNMAPRLGGALPGLLKREKAAGRMRADSDPAISALLILAVCVFPFIAQSLAEPVLGVKFDTQGIKRLNHQISELLTRGMTT